MRREGRERGEERGAVMGIVECKKKRSVCVLRKGLVKCRGRPCYSPCKACLLVLQQRVEDPGKFSSGDRTQ